MDTLLLFVKDYWPLLLVAAVVLAVLNFLKRVAFKIVGALAVVVLVLVFFFNYSPMDATKKVGGAVYSAYEATVKTALEAEIKNAQYTSKADGSYELKTQSVKLVGKKGDPKATVYFKDQSFQMDVSAFSSAVQQQIDGLHNQKK